MVWRAFHDSAYIFNEASVSLQLDSPTKIKTPLPSSSDQNIRGEINTPFYPECGKRWACFLVFTMHVAVPLWGNMTQCSVNCFFPSGIADCDMKYSSTLTRPWTMGALRPTTIWGISRLLMSLLHVRSQTSHSQGSTPSEAAHWMRRLQEIHDCTPKNKITIWIILKSQQPH